MPVFFFFLGSHLWHMEIPRLRVKSELQLLAHTTATAMADPSSVFDLHHGLWKHPILNPLSKAVIKPETLWILVEFVTAEP